MITIWSIYGLIARAQLAAAQTAPGGGSSAFPTPTNSNTSPVDKILTFLGVVFDGLIALGAGIAGVALAYIFVVAIGGGRPNVKWATIAIVGGIGLTSLGWLLNQIF